jgi:hypothetical protein
MMNVSRQENIVENTDSQIKTVGKLPNETEVMQSYVNMIEDNLY